VAAEGDGEGEEQGDEEAWTAVHAYARAARAVRAARATAPTARLAWPLLPPSWRPPTAATTADTATDTATATAAAASALEGVHEVLIFLAGTGAAWAAVPVRPRNFLSDALGAHLAALRGTPPASPPVSPSHAPAVAATAAPAAPHAAPGKAPPGASSEAPNGAPADAPSAAHLLPRARVLLLLAHALRADYHLLTLPLRRALRAVAGDLHGAGPAAAALATEADAALRAMGFD